MVVLILVCLSCQPVLFMLPNGHSLCVSIKGSAMATSFFSGSLHRLVKQSSWCGDQVPGRGFIFRVPKWLSQITVWIPKKSLSIGELLFSSDDGIYWIKHLLHIHSDIHSCFYSYFSSDDWLWLLNVCSGQDDVLLVVCCSNTLRVHFSSPVRLSPILCPSYDQIS